MDFYSHQGARMSEWTIVEGNRFAFTADDPEGWYDAWVKFDGCIEFKRFFNLPKGDPDQDAEDFDGMHICDLDQVIERLQSLRKVAVEYFAAQGQNRWPG